MEKINYRASLIILAGFAIFIVVIMGYIDDFIGGAMALIVMEAFREYHKHKNQEDRPASFWKLVKMDDEDIILKRYGGAAKDKGSKSLDAVAQFFGIRDQYVIKFSGEPDKDGDIIDKDAEFKDHLWLDIEEGDDDED